MPNPTQHSPALQPDPRAQPDLVSSSTRREVIREAGEDHTHTEREGKENREMKSWPWVSLRQEATHLFVLWLYPDSPGLHRGEGALPAMIAARSSSVGRGGPDESSRHRRQSAASLAGHRGHRSSQESNRDSHAQHRQAALLRARRAFLIREMETNWYLKLCGRAREDSVAYETGMPYRWVLKAKWRAAGWIWCLRNPSHSAVLFV